VILDPDLAAHGYQLWTAAVGTIVDAQARGKDEAVLVIHQFHPLVPAQGTSREDLRDWPKALDEHQAAVEVFVAAPRGRRGVTHTRAFVRPATTLHVLVV
jgi:hypothetical protein